MKTITTDAKITDNYSTRSNNKIVKRLSTLKQITLLLVGILILGISYSFLETFWVENKIYTIKSSEIPPAFEGKRIAFIADTHHGIFFSRSRIHTIVKKVNEQNYDLILLGGDYVVGSSRFIRPCFEELSKLHAPLGVFGVLGNHDHWQGAELSRSAMRGAGIGVIDNGALWVSVGGQRIRVGGVGDHCEDVQKLDLTVAGVSKQDFVVLVSHSPDYAPEITGDKVDLILSGHTHGGQITFFNLFAPKVPSRYGQKFRTGNVTVNNMQVIISNGIGTVMMPLRFFARPQIVVVELKKQ